MAGIPEALKAAPGLYRLILENDRVRVMELRLKPGEKAPMHDHPTDHVIYVVSGARFKLTTPDGEVDTLDLTTGQTLWLAAGSHEAENVGTTEGHNLVVEIKNPK
jgi:quercetin dioxygenase-like cupin family protein